MKRGPIVLILGLIFILIFILGLRYGQRVERTNKVVDYLLSLPPTKPPEPTQESLAFKDYIHKGCGVQFLYPTSLTLQNESSTSALFTEKKREQIKLKCDSKIIAASTEAGLLRRYNPRNGKMVTIMVDESLQSLVEKSLEFVR